MRDRSIILTESEIEEGIKTRFWAAVLEWLDESLDTIHVELEDMDKGNDLGIFKRLSGNAEVIRRVRMLPQIFEEEAKIYNEERS